MNPKPKSRLVIVVQRGTVNAVYCSKEDVISEVEIVDLDSTEFADIRRGKLRAKKAKRSMKQIY